MKKLLILLSILGICGIAEAVPSITSTTGTIEHNGSLTISGSSFGTKTNYGEGRSQLNWIWDNAENYSTFSSAGWSEGLPSGSGNAYNLTYSGSLTASQATSVSTKYLTGCHFPDNAYYTGGDVAIFAGGTDTFTKYYARWYYYEESPFTYKTAGVKGDWDIRNNKNFVLQDRDSLYAGGGTGISYAYVDNNNLAIYTDDWTQVWGVDGLYDANHTTQWGREIQTNGFGTLTGDKYGTIPNGGTAGHWELWEVEGSDLTSSGTSQLKVWINGSLEMNATSNDLAFSAKGFGIGGYRDRSNNTSFRKYFDDMYIDKDWARIVIGNNSNYTSCTVREIQIPTAWSSSSATITVNQGSFADDATAYLYLIDSNGVVSDQDPVADGFQGYEITFGEEGGGVTPSISSTNGTYNTGETINIYGSDFKSTQGTGKVYLCDQSTYSGSSVKTEQTVVTWSDTAIVSTFVETGFTDGQYAYYIVLNSDGNYSVGYQVQLYYLPPTPPQTSAGFSGSGKISGGGKIS